MEYQTRRYPHNASLGFPNYCFADRNIPLAMSHGSRTDSRNCPIGNPAGGSRGPGNMGRDDGASENGQSRRRIAVACARCRKRKIRCSGDPGNGSGCQNCKSAGVDTNYCQFHRVGSDDAAQMISNRNIATNMAYIATPTTLMPIYNVASSPFYTRPVTASQYPQIDTKTVFPQTWTIPYSEDTSPVETYNMDQSAAYMPDHNSMTNVYDNYRWSQAHGLPYIHTKHQAAVGNEAQSPLNMASLHSTLPVSIPQKPHSLQIEATVPRRQLPIPQPSPSQSSRNVVDQLQDQRLRSAQIMGGSLLNISGTFGKPAMTWNSETTVSDFQRDITADAASLGLMTQITSSTPGPGTTEGTMGYLPVTASVNETVTVTGNATAPPPPQQQQQLNFRTSTLLESMSAPTATPAYSNFRNYTLPTTSSTEQGSLLARQNSHTNLYSFTPDSTSKRHSLGDPSNEAALVSGQRYTPLSQPQTQHPASLDSSRTDSFKTRNGPLHRGSMSNLSRTY